MALRNIRTSEEWQSFFQEELQLSPDISKSYGEELASQNITGANIGIGLAEPGFLNQFNMTVGHQLELKTKFRIEVKTEFTGSSGPINKVPIPTVEMDITRIQFDQFKYEWEKYKEHYKIYQNVATSLFFCCSEKVRQQIRIIQATQNLTWTEQSLMDAIRNTVLSKTSAIIHVKQFLEVKQEDSESVQHFLQRLQTKASCCEFSCHVCHSSNFEERVKEKFILGLRDTLIQRSVLKTESVTHRTPLSKLLTEAITIEQSLREQETISRPTGHDVVCKIDENESDEFVNAVNHKARQAVECTHCGSNSHSSFERREKCPAWGKKCNNCQTLHHFQRMCLKPKKGNKQNFKKSANQAEMFFIGEIGETSSLQLPVKMKMKDHLRFQSLEVFPDTGANICLMGHSQLRQLKLKTSDLKPCINKIAVAGGASITATGWTDVEVVLGERSTLSKVYFSKRVSRFFLSRQCCRDLGIISQSFPYPQVKEDSSYVAAAVEVKYKIPEKPSAIPFEPIEGNIPACNEEVSA